MEDIAGKSIDTCKSSRRRQPVIVYLHRNPGVHPRTLKIKNSLEKRGFRFVTFRPRFQVNLRSRLLSSAVNYSLFFLQSLLVRGDIIWVANCPDTVGLGPCLARKKYVYDYRSPWSKEVEIEFGKGVISAIAGIIERMVRSSAYAVVVVDTQDIEDVKHLGKPIFLISNYPLKSFAPSKTRELVRNMSGCAYSDKVVLFVGKLSKVEGADMLQKIAEGLAPLGGIKLWIVGDGPLRLQIKDLEIRYPNIVKFFGWIDYKEIPNYISAADVCIVPRHKTPISEYYSEQGVQKISEYISLGKPVVACNIAQSSSYLMVSEDSFVDGIKAALDGRAPIAEKRFWESDSEPVLMEAINLMLANRDTPFTKSKAELKEEA